MKKRRFTNLRKRFLFFMIGVGLIGLAACSTADSAPPPTPPASTPPARDYWPTEDWREADPAEAGLDAAILAEVSGVIERELPFLNGLLIVKDGNLIHEAYFNDYGPADLYTLNSVTKSVVSALYGMAIADGSIPGLDTTLAEALPAYFDDGGYSDLAVITLGDLLRMRSGLEWDEGKLEQDLSTVVMEGGTDAGIAFFSQLDIADYVLRSGMAYPPGEAWSYSSGDTNLLSAAFSAMAGRSLADYAAETLFPALGITDWDWIEDANGVSIGGIGLQLTPRDMAKFGYLYLNRGAWDGHQLIPAEWVYASTYPQSVGLFTGNSQTMPIEWYGMQWWNWKPDVFSGHRAIAAQGYAGQSVTLIPDLDLIVVTTADTLVPPDVAEQQLALIYDLIKFNILPAAGSPEMADPFWANPVYEQPPATLLYTSGTDGRDQTVLLNDPGYFHWGAAWSPDGQQIAFSRGKNVGPIAPGSPVIELHIVSADGTGLRQLTNNGRNNYLPAWSPDGSRIAYISSRARLNTHEIYVIDTDGSDDTNLTNNDVQEYGVAWSPDGSRIAFGTKLGGDMQVYTMNPDGSDQRPLPTAAAGMAPSWSPDGTQIVFATERNGNSDIYTMNADGSNQQALVTGESWDYAPVWSPDGTQIAFTSTRDGDPAIYIVPADGGEPERVSGRNRVADIASWSPDGQQLVFHGQEAPRKGILDWFRQ